MTRFAHRFVTTAGAIAFTALIATLPAAAAEREQPKKLMSPDEAIKIITSLEGTWQGLQLGDTQVTVDFETVARGTAVLEVIGRGTKKEMATVYAIEDNELIANHYCLGGYRTQLRFNRERSTPDRLIFDYVNLANVNLQRSPKTVYVNGLVLEVPGGDGVMARSRGLGYSQEHAQGLENLGLHTTELKPAPRAK